MALRIMDGPREGLGHPAFDGVPRTSGRATDGGGDELALKLLMFIDGSSSLRDLAEVLSLQPGDLVRVVVELHREGVILFDDAYTGKWLSEPEPEPSTPEDADPGPGGEGEAPSQEAGPGRIRLMDDGPSRPVVVDEAPADEAPAEEPEEVPGEIVEEGRLEDTPAWQVLTRIARTDLSGWLRFSEPAGRRDVLLGAGHPVNCLSDVEDEGLASLLRQRDIIDEESYARARQAGAGGGDDSRLLVRLGILPEYNRLRALRWQAQTLLFKLLELDRGTFLVEKLERLPRRVHRFDLNFSRILTRFLDEKLPVDDEVEKLQEKMDFYLVPTKAAPTQTFQDKEQRLWEVIQERPRRLRDIFSVSTMFRRETYKFILLLLVNGLVELQKSVKFEEGPVDLRLVEDIAEDLADQNYFDILGVHAVGDAADVAAGYRRMTTRFDPAAFKSLDEDQRASLARIRVRVEEAHETLKDERKRNEYRRQVFSAYQLAQFAQLQYQKGEIYLWWRQSPREAFPFFRSAMELDPAQPLFWAAYALGALSGGSSDPAVRRQSLQLAERVSGMSNVDPAAFVLAGGALIKAGQAGRGEECLERARKLSPGNVAIAKMIKTVLKGEA